MAKSDILNNPIISVIIPTYNYADKLGEAIESVLKQSFKDFELIVVDDNSSDTTEKVMAKFTDERIIYIKNAKRLGVYKTVNIGIKKARGDYFCQLDADDKFYSSSLQLRYNYLTTHSLEAVHTGIFVIDNENKIYIPPLDTSKQRNIIAFLKGEKSEYGINACTFLFSRKVIEKICYRDESDEFFPHNDYEYALRILLNCKVGFIDKPTYIYQRHVGSHSDNHGHSLVSEARLQSLTDKYIQKFTS